MEGPASILFLTVIVTTKSLTVCGISIESLLGTKVAGGVETLRIICRAGTTDAARHNSLVLSRNLSISYQTLVTISENKGNAITTWSNEAGAFETRTRATATGTMTGGSSKLTVEVPDFECSDAGIYRCSLNGLHNDFTPVLPVPTATATLSVIGRNGNLTLQITEYLEHGTQNPQTSNETSWNQIQYFNAGTVVTLECEGDINKVSSNIGSGSQTLNRIDWYRLRPAAFSWERYDPPNSADITNKVIGGSQNTCLERVQSTLRYTVSYINDNGGTAFRCQTSSTLGSLSESNQMRIFACSTEGNVNLTLRIAEYLKPGVLSPQALNDDVAYYFEAGTVITMECDLEIGKITNSHTENYIVWYRLLSSSSSWELYSPPNVQDVTTEVIADSQYLCIQKILSKLKYYVSSIDNGGTFFWCMTSSTLDGMSQSNVKKIFAGENTTISSDGTGGAESNDTLLLVLVALVCVIVGVIIIMVVLWKTRVILISVQKENCKCCGQKKEQDAYQNDAFFCEIRTADRSNADGVYQDIGPTENSIQDYHVLRSPRAQ